MARLRLTLNCLIGLEGGQLVSGPSMDDSFLREYHDNGNFVVISGGRAACPQSSSTQIEPRTTGVIDGAKER